jgi:uncharacterized protein (TIGR00661 family)
LKAKVFITDEGFGPIVRQSAILEELRVLIPSLDVTLQMERHYDQARQIMPNVTHRKKFNNVIWQKKSDGSPDTKAITEYYRNYNALSDKYIETEKEDLDYDFIISDFVYEAFELARIKKIPAFGVAHFTWDWFFSKFYPPVISHDVINKMIARAFEADILFFPAFTPPEIISYYRKKVVEVPLIVRKQNPVFSEREGKLKKVMFIDSGSGVNKLAMIEIVKQLPLLFSFQFFIGELLAIPGANITTIPKNDLLVDHIAAMDLVVGRAGFNTISECIACRTPMLLFGENSNPEMRENTIFVKEEGLGSFTSIDSLLKSVERVLNDFFEGEYGIIERNMKRHAFRTDGARVVAEIIAEKILPS